MSPEVESGINLIFGRGGKLGMLHVMEFPWDEQGKPKAGQDADLLSVWDGLQYDNTRDYVNLSVWSPHGSISRRCHRPAGARAHRG